jgi:hypothetical protein
MRAPRRASGLCRVQISEVQRREHRRRIVCNTIHRRAEIQQDVDQGGLYLSAGRMCARDEQVHRRFPRTAAVGIGTSVDRRAGLEQPSRNRHRVGRRFLAEVLHAIGGDVVQERGAMDAMRVRANQAGMPSEQLVEHVEVASHNGVSREFEWIAVNFHPGESIEMLAERGPVLKSMRISDEELCVGKRERRARFPDALIDMRDRSINTCVHECGRRHRQIRDERLNPVARPPLDRGVLIRSCGSHQRLCALLVIVEIGFGRERQRIHTELLSKTPGVRSDQAERKLSRFKLFQPHPWWDAVQGGHGPFGGRDASPSAD